MIICNKGKWAFIHNPKACGTSVREILGRYHDDEVQFWHQGWHRAESRVVDLAHLTADHWYGEDMVPVEFTTFGFARDPYTRFASAMNETRRRHPQLFTNHGDFLKMLTPANIRYDWRFIHFCPQHAFFFFKDKRLVDFIGKFETLEKDWKAVRAVLGDRLDDQVPFVLPHARPSNTVNRPLSPEETQLVNDLYYRDFLLLDYPMLGSISSDTYASRMEIIHDPVKFSTVDIGSIVFTQNEKKALDAKMKDT
jgi:hypothetical protein